METPFLTFNIISTFLNWCAPKYSVNFRQFLLQELPWFIHTVTLVGRIPQATELQGDMTKY